MYQSFRVKNFRCFRDLQVNDLGRVNLIAGRNNTGKTALMEAMYILAGNRDAKTLLRMKLRTVYRLLADSEMRDAPSDASDIISWRNLFTNYNTDSEIVMRASLQRPLLPLFPNTNTLTLRLRTGSRPIADFEDILYRFRVDDIELLEQSELLEFVNDHAAVNTHLLLANGNVVGLRGATDTAIEAEFLSATEKQSARVNAKRFSDLRLSTGTAALCDTLRVIDPRLQRLELLYDGYRTHMYADLGSGAMQSLTGLGDGIQRVASITLALNDQGIDLLFIDEIENGIHHSVQCQVWQAIGKLAHELDIQVFATTHSLEMIRAAYEAFSADGRLSELRLHRLDRDSETSEIAAVTYNERGMKALETFDFDFEVRG